eukprot:4956482-Pyramimonas_sp.AAC.2
MSRLKSKGALTRVLIRYLMLNVADGAGSGGRGHCLQRAGQAVGAGGAHGRGRGRTAGLTLSSHHALYKGLQV